MYQFEEVKNDEGLALAKELKAIYHRTSAKEASGGIDELFKSIGKKFLDPNSEITSKGQKKMRDKIRNNQKKKMFVNFQKNIIEKRTNIK